MKVIATDFDGTLCANKWPDIGGAHHLVIKRLLERQQNGDKLILWTCREGLLLSAALLWCLKHGLRFDAVNDNLPENVELYGKTAAKYGQMNTGMIRQYMSARASRPNLRIRSRRSARKPTWKPFGLPTSSTILQISKVALHHPPIIPP